MIARHSAFTYKGKSVTLKQVGRELGVRYILEGSVRKAGTRLRITAQLIDAATDHHLWAERYDRNIDDIFLIQEEVARHVAGALAVALKPDERERLAHVPTENISVYDRYLRTRTRPWPPTSSNIESAKSAYQSIIDIEPTFAGGFAGKSIAHSMAVLFGHSAEPETEAKAAKELAEKAVDVDSQFARSHSALGLAYAALRRSEDSVAAARRAVELQPGDADSHAWLARCLMWAGEGEEACQEVQAALRLDPQYTEGPYYNLLARVSFIAGRYADTIAAYEWNDAHGGPHQADRFIYWAAACGQLGHTKDAQGFLRQLSRTYPDLTLRQAVSLHGMKSSLEIQKLTEGLRKAGVRG